MHKGLICRISKSLKVLALSRLFLFMVVLGALASCTTSKTGHAHNDDQLEKSIKPAEKPKNIHGTMVFEAAYMGF